MNISQYLEVHRFAIKKQFEIIREYHDRYADALRDATFAGERATARAVELAEADADPDEIYTQRDLWNHFQRLQAAHQESVQAKLKLQEVEQHLSGINQLCGLILQSAKQGISTAHRGSGWVKGRDIGTQKLGNVIRQARNQAAHYEENDPSTGVSDCFNKLHTDLGITNDLTINLARHVVFDVLHWYTYDAYHADMVTSFS